MNLTVVVEPPVEPLSLADMYGQCRLDPEDSPPTHPDDDLLQRCITAARVHCEERTRRAFVQQTIRLSVDAFPRSCYSYIELLRPPLIEVQSVQYYDVDNELQTVDSADYFTTDDLVPRLMFVTTFGFPCTYHRNDAVRITYVVGYPPEGSPPDDYIANIPATLKQAMLLLAADLYENREGQIIGTIRSDNPTLDALLINPSLPKA